MSAAYDDWESLHAQDGPPPQFAEPPPQPSFEIKGGKRSRQTYSKYQTAVLETVFQTSKYIVRSKRQQMSAELNLSERQIKIWFQNRRMKEKKCGGVGGLHCKESPPVDAVVGYGDGYAAVGLGAAGHHATTAIGDVVDGDPLLLRDDAFADFCHRAAARHRPPQPPSEHRDPAAGYVGYVDCGVGGGGGGYDPLAHHHGPDPYAAAAKQHHWGGGQVTAVDYEQDFFGDHDDLDHFQRLQTSHHHHYHHHRRPMTNSQVPDYCAPQLQAAHGY